MGTRPYSVWARSIFSPRKRLLPGIGRRLGRHPRLASAVLVGLRRVPGRTVRTALYVNVSRPIVEQMDARLVVPICSGSRMIVDTSDMIGRVLATSGVWEPHVTAPIRRLLRAGDVFVDVGANIGYFTLLGSGLVGPTGRVYALEPNGPVHVALRRNIQLNKLGNVVPLCVAAGAADGFAELVEPPVGNVGGTSVRRSDASSAQAETGIVPIRALGSLLEERDAARVRLVKVDVEGFEGEVLRGLELLYADGRRPALLVEIHSDATVDAVEILAGMCTSFGLEAYELRRNPYRDRFAEVPAPRRIVDPWELVGLCSTGTVNVLLAADDSLSGGSIIQGGL